MIEEVPNPWHGMHANATRRVDHKSIHNFHWVKDQNSRFGILVIFDTLENESELITKIQGLTIIKRIDNSVLELYLIINDNKDWEIFYTLCNDLVKVSADCGRPEKLIKVINNRLKRWQKFLSQGKILAMTEIQQMGLLTELHFLLNVLVPDSSATEAILAWVGPDFDKQDFSIKNAFVEIKSFISSKGPFVRISSLHQLNFTIKPLFMIACALSRSEIGISILDLIGQINGLFQETENLIREDFENKLAQYGFLFNITEPPFYKWTIDSVVAYSVIDRFPKLLSTDVPNQIISAEYTIDLSKCSEFETDINTIFKT